jgi:hypothetical protein
VTPSEVTAALEWSRLEIAPAFPKKAAYARFLGVPRTTYVSAVERGTFNTELFNRITERRGLVPEWYKGKFSTISVTRETKSVYQRSLSREHEDSGTAALPSILTPSIGILTKGSLGDEQLQRRNGAVKVPANMSGPNHIIAIADQRDTGLYLPHGWLMLFLRGKRGKLGNWVSVKISATESTLREVAFVDGRMVYKGLNSQTSLDMDQYEEEGLLVGYLAPDNRPGKFRAEYDDEGHLMLPIDPRYFASK